MRHARAAHPADPGLRDGRHPGRRPARRLVLRGSADRRDRSARRRDHARTSRTTAAWSAPSRTATCKALIADGSLPGPPGDRSRAPARSSGVNRFVSDEAPPDLATYELDAEGRKRQLERLAQVKAERDNAAVAARLDDLRRAAEGTDNLMGPPIDCANAYCTVGEIVAALKAVWGEFQRPVVF
ncbi:methylmalonyl-CoA mutase family protein [Yinghuangia aomiensis]